MRETYSNHTHYSKCFDAEFEHLLRHFAGYRDFVQRLELFSQYFMDRPYLVGALGEGEHGDFDQSPLYRTDAFDCLTYVNTVLALVRSDNLMSFRRELLQINYAESKPRYENRLHFMAEWNSINAARGVIRDITAELVANPAVRQRAVTWIDKPNWFRHRHLADIKLLASLTAEAIQSRLAQLQTLADQQTCLRSELDYIPLTALFPESGVVNAGLFERIPQGAIIEIVRPNWDLREQIGTHIDVSHLGFVFWQQNECILRHASSEIGKVCEQPLVAYLQQYLSSPTIKGINVQQPLVFPE